MSEKISALRSHRGREETTVPCWYDVDPVVLEDDIAVVEDQETTQPATVGYRPPADGGMMWILDWRCVIPEHQKSKQE